MIRPVQGTVAELVDATGVNVDRKARIGSNAECLIAGSNPASPKGAKMVSIDYKTQKGIIKTRIRFPLAPQMPVRFRLGC